MLGFDLVSLVGLGASTARLSFCFAANASSSRTRLRTALTAFAAVRCAALAMAASRAALFSVEVGDMLAALEEHAEQTEPLEARVRRVLGLMAVHLDLKHKTGRQKVADKRKDSPAVLWDERVRRRRAVPPALRAQVPARAPPQGHQQPRGEREPRECPPGREVRGHNCCILPLSPAITPVAVPVAVQSRHDIRHTQHTSHNDNDPATPSSTSSTNGKLPRRHVLCRSPPSARAGP